VIVQCFVVEGDVVDFVVGCERVCLWFDFLCCEDVGYWCEYWVVVY